MIYKIFNFDKYRIFIRWSCASIFEFIIRNFNMSVVNIMDGEVCSTIFNAPQELCAHLVRHSDDNTEKHRVPLTKPRKCKKWKVSRSEEISNEPSIFIGAIEINKQTSHAIHNKEVRNEYERINEIDDFKNVIIPLISKNEDFIPFNM